MNFIRQQNLAWSIIIILYFFIDPGFLLLGVRVQSFVSSVDGTNDVYTCPLQVRAYVGR